MQKKKRSSDVSLMPLFVVVCIFLVFFTFFLIGKLNSSDKALIPLSIFPLVLGLIFEYRRICASWKYVLQTTACSYILSFIAFLPGRSERNYNLEFHVQIWPYAFCLICIIIIIAAHEEKIIAKLTEGITLLLSLSLIYTVVDIGVDAWDNNFLRLLMVIVLGFSAYSIYNAFSSRAITKNARLALSIWSSVILIVFSIDNTYHVYQNRQIENTGAWSNVAYVAGQYFLLGISSIYMVQNVLMIGSYLPGKGEFFNAAHFKRVSETNKKHIDRYSAEQVSPTQSFLCIFFTAIVFGTNYYFNFLPRNMIIWIVFTLFPIVIHLYQTAFPEIGHMELKGQKLVLGKRKK